MDWHRIWVVLVGICGFGPLWGQSVPTYAGEIQPILAKHCTPCHQPDGVAPFSLTGYADVQKRARMIAHVTETGLMPPWPADPGYRHFQNENVLSDAEKKLIREWAENGAPEGIAGNSGKVRLKESRKQASLVQMAPSRSVSVPASQSDRFVFQLLPDTLSEDVFVQGFQFHPGNRKVVHHLELLAVAPGDWPAGLDSNFTEREYFPSSLNAQFQGKLNYISGWLPGNQGEQFPKGIGRKLERGTRFVLMVHYGPNSQKTQDLSTVDMLICRKKPKRLLESFDFHGGENLPGRKLEIPPDTVITFHAQREVTEDLSLISIYPHAHHLAQAMDVFAILPQGDTLPLLRIPQWQFDWQMRYDFEEFVHLPEGTIVHFLATYDNTENNPENPFSPPRLIPNSFNANDEMMELFLWTLPFRQRDAGHEIKFLPQNRK